MPLYCRNYNVEKFLCPQLIISIIFIKGKIIAWKFIHIKTNRKIMTLLGVLLISFLFIYSKKKKKSKALKTNPCQKRAWSFSCLQPAHVGACLHHQYTCSHRCQKLGDPAPGPTHIPANWMGPQLSPGSIFAVLFGISEWELCLLETVCIFQTRLDRSGFQVGNFNEKISKILEHCSGHVKWPGGRDGPAAGLHFPHVAHR